MAQQHGCPEGLGQAGEFLVDDGADLAPGQLVAGGGSAPWDGREALFPRILEMAIAVGVGEASVDEIDLINIRQATHLAMSRSVRALATAPLFALVDGNDAPALPCPCDTIIDGDARSVSIAAASIIAKVTRDRMMVALHEQHPGYGWFTNKGYSTEAHIEALNRLGPCPHHRRSFAPRPPATLSGCFPRRDFRARAARAVYRSRGGVEPLLMI